MSAHRPARATATPTLSVVVPTHDTRELTLRCLDSLAPGSLALEVIVVDDASAVGTAEAIARHHPEVRLLANAPRAGFTRAANRGLDVATVDVLLR